MKGLVKTTGNFNGFVYCLTSPRICMGIAISRRDGEKDIIKYTVLNISASGT